MHVFISRIFEHFFWAFVSDFMWYFSTHEKMISNFYEWITYFERIKTISYTTIEIDGCILDVDAASISAKPYILQKKYFQGICTKFQAFWNGHGYFWPLRSQRLLEAKNPAKCRSRRSGFFGKKVVINVAQQPQKLLSRSHVVSKWESQFQITVQLGWLEPVDELLSSSLISWQSQQRKKGVSPQGAVVVFLRFLETIWFMN